ncbi:MAG: hypothetical protein SGI87_09895 [Flavobacteriales bacterium]|nr:hypothetical protein [Flavobacteriales bacterium]
MKTIIISLAVFLFSVTVPQSSFAEDLGRKPSGYNYAKHAKKNQKAAKWSKKRMRAAKGNMINVKCNAHQSARYARGNR